MKLSKSNINTYKLHIPVIEATGATLQDKQIFTDNIFNSINYKNKNFEITSGYSKINF
jgi:hypothetical protein